MANPANHYLTVSQVAERLQLTESAVYKKCRGGEIPSVKLGKSVRVPVDALERYEKLARGELQPVYSDQGTDDPAPEHEDLHEAFISVTGMEPEEWIDGWRSGRIADTPETGQITIRALALRQGRERESAQEPAAPRTR